MSEYEGNIKYFVRILFQFIIASSVMTGTSPFGKITRRGNSLSVTMATRLVPGSG